MSVRDQRVGTSHSDLALHVSDNRERLSPISKTHILNLNMNNDRDSTLKELYDAHRFQRNDWVPEQERNFDAQYSPPRPTMAVKGYECIDGTWYKVWQA